MFSVVFLLFQMYIYYSYLNHLNILSNSHEIFFPALLNLMKKTFWNCLFYDIHIAAGLEYGIWGESYGYVKFCMNAHLLKLQW